MDKIDLFKQFKAEYVMPKAPALVDIGPAHYLAIGGTAEPGSAAYQETIEVLYTVAYTMKFARKKSGGEDYKVATLEGLYREKCDWTLLIRVPEFITQTDIAATAEALIAKGKGDAVRRVKLLKLKEGRCAQLLQVGPYESVCQSMQAVSAFVAAQGLELTGQLHEIYLSDPRRVPPEKLKTLIRYPVRKAA